MTIYKQVAAYKVGLESNDRQAFELAMIERINSEGGFRVNDMVYEIYQCQKEIEGLKNQLVELQGWFCASVNSTKAIRKRPQCKKKS